MKKLLTILHAEDHLSPSALSIVKGGDNPIIKPCTDNVCDVNKGSCTENNCSINDQKCVINKCGINCLSHVNVRPDCPTAGTGV